MGGDARPIVANGYLEAPFASGRCYLYPAWMRCAALDLNGINTQVQQYLPDEGSISRNFNGRCIDAALNKNLVAPRLVADQFKRIFYDSVNVRGRDAFLAWP